VEEESRPTERGIHILIEDFLPLGFHYQSSAFTIRETKFLELLPLIPNSFDINTEKSPNLANEIDLWSVQLKETSKIGTIRRSEKASAGAISGNES
jgi:hypothetical protein